MSSEYDWGKRDWQAGYKNCRDCPEGYWLEAEEGALPQELLGTYFRNGPGLLELGTERVAHPYDGHGLVASFAFRAGRVYFRSQYVQTTEYQQEQQEQRFLYPGAFGTRPKQSAADRSHIPCWLGGFMPKNAANTGVLPWQGGTCLALFEAGPPHLLSATSLHTHGVSLLEGLLRPGIPFQTGLTWLDGAAGRLLSWLAGSVRPGKGVRLGGDALCAHTCQDPATGRTVIMSYCLSVTGRRGALGSGARSWLRGCMPGLQTQLTFWELDEDFQPVVQQTHTLPGYAFVHDFAVCEGHYVVFRNPVSLALAPLATGRRSCVQCIRFHADRELEIHLVPRPAAGCPAPVQPSRSFSAAACARDSWSSALPAQAGDDYRPCDSHGAAPASLTPDCSVYINGPATGSAADTSEKQVPRGPQAVPKSEAAFVFHHANAYSEGRHVVVDSICYSHFPDFFQLGQPGHNFFEDIDPRTEPISQLWRFQLDAAAGTIARRRILDRAVEFPAINPLFAGRRHRYVWVAASLDPSRNGPQQALARIDTADGTVDMWSRGRRYFAGEPIFVPRTCTPEAGGAGDESEGWLLAVCFDAGRARSELVVLDAARVSAGPVAVLPLRGVLPHGLHGCWDDRYHGPTFP